MGSVANLGDEGIPTIAVVGRQVEFPIGGVDEPSKLLRPISVDTEQNIVGGVEYALGQTGVAVEGRDETGEGVEVHWEFLSVVL